MPHFTHVREMEIDDIEISFLPYQNATFIRCQHTVGDTLGTGPRVVCGSSR